MKTILIAPLDWGLGHATRDIPLIHQLIKANYKVIIAADNYPANLLHREFPNLEQIKLSGTQINYSKRNSSNLKIILQIPKFLLSIKKEHRKVNEIIKQYKIDLIISDNRYGVYSKSIPSIFITHQISVKLPSFFYVFEYITYKLHIKYIKKFNKCLIPDYDNKNNISGDLSHKYTKPVNAEFIGILSRFRNTKKRTIKRRAIAVISGAEPQRTIFFNLILKEFKKLNMQTLIVAGIPSEAYTSQNKKIEIINHLNAKDLQIAIEESEIVICRSGYSSVMDLLSIGRSAILVPTPGQTEQEYLAKYLTEKKYFVSCKQKNFNIEKCIFEYENTSFITNKISKLKKTDFISIIEKELNTL